MTVQETHDELMQHIKNLKELEANTGEQDGLITALFINMQLVCMYGVQSIADGDLKCAGKCRAVVAATFTMLDNDGIITK